MASPTWVSTLFLHCSRGGWLPPGYWRDGWQWVPIFSSPHVLSQHQLMGEDIQWGSTSTTIHSCCNTVGRGRSHLCGGKNWTRKWCQNCFHCLRWTVRSCVALPSNNSHISRQPQYLVRWNIISSQSDSLTHAWLHYVIVVVDKFMNNVNKLKFSFVTLFYCIHIIYTSHIM